VVPKELEIDPKEFERHPAEDPKDKHIENFLRDVYDLVLVIEGRYHNMKARKAELGRMLN